MKPLVIETHTAGGNVRTADLLTSIAKRLRTLTEPDYNVRRKRPDGQRDREILRVSEMRRLAQQIDRLAATLEGKQ